MNKLLTKKNIMVISSIGAMLFLVWDYLGNYFWCDLFFKNGSQGGCPFVISDIQTIFLPIFPLFLFSLITYKMRDEVFQVWGRFAAWWIPLSMFLILITPTDYGGSGIGMSFGKPDVAFITSFLFVVISTLLIVWKWFVLRGKK